VFTLYRAAALTMMVFRGERWHAGPPMEPLRHGRSARATDLLLARSWRGGQRSQICLQFHGARVRPGHSWHGNQRPDPDPAECGSLASMVRKRVRRACQPLWRAGWTKNATPALARSLDGSRSQPGQVGRHKRHEMVRLTDRRKTRAWAPIQVSYGGPSPNDSKPFHTVYGKRPESAIQPAKSHSVQRPMSGQISPPSAN
jgi:hypothetical protein